MLGREARSHSCQKDTLDFLRRMLKEMAKIAGANDFQMLNFLVEMAHLEACDEWQRQNERQKCVRAPTLH